MNQVGVYGMGVMGRSLAHNIARKGYSVSVYNIEESGVKLFLDSAKEEEKVNGYVDLKEFVLSLSKPKIIFLMVTAGRAVDIVIDGLKEYIDEGDIILDCGNSYYKDTIRRFNELDKMKIHFLGIGVSGGEKGALEGPSIMPSGDKLIYDKYIKDILEKISAKNDRGEPCTTYVGPNGSGHFVKMIHNGIEYGDLQIICEAYDFMRKVGNLSIEEIQKIFVEWNKGILSSYLIEITADILQKKDEKTGKYLIDVILDEAGQKGTGKWTSMEALDIGVAIPTIAESVFARYLSSAKKERVEASKLYKKEIVAQPLEKDWLDNLEKTVYSAKVISYAQGFDLLKKASKEYDWNLNLAEIARIWENGCIIRANFLNDIDNEFKNNAELTNLLVSPYFKERIESFQVPWRKTCALGVLNGVYLPVINASLNYYDGYTSKLLPANLLQAQRDYFGAHGYKRIDDPEENLIHTVWEN